ncbi:MAG: ribonuclease Y [Fastidiosipilaceae bacterium]
MITINWLHIFISLVVGLIIGIVACVIYFHKGLSKREQALIESKEQQEREAKRLLGEAQKSGERQKHELLLEAKEEIHKSRLELEKSVRDRKSELQRERNRIEQKEESLDSKLANVEQQRDDLSQQLAEVEEMKEQARLQEEKIFSELERISGLTVEEARTVVLDSAREEYRHDMAVMYKQMEDETKVSADIMAQDIIATAIHRYSADYVSESTVTVVTLPNDDMKGRIIGREGRNIRAIETLTGVDLIIDDTPEAVILSSFNPIRREVARIALEKLIQDGRIHPARIEEAVAKAQKELDQTIKEEGDRTAFETGVMGLDENLLRLLGRMRYRTSYRQNALKHSIEVCWFAGLMAAELGLDVDMAKRAGLLHDIGKAIDYETEGSHIEIGAEIARKAHEDPTVINAIESHHGDVEPTNSIAVLVAAADALSAARPGARQENIETYVKRIQQLEEIVKNYSGVDNCYAIQAGREIRVMVIPDQIQDEDMALMAREIGQQIEDELNYPGQIKISMIRETRVTDYAR